MRSPNDKFLPREQVAEICVQLRREGRKIGFTSGAFDLLHAGHADYLDRARRACDVLVVGVNTDDSVRRYKGPSRPLIPEEQRARLVAALESVDYVFLFPERRNARNIELIQPDYYIKGGDYTTSSLTSGDLVKSYGGQLLLLEVRETVSTSQIIQQAAASLGLTENAIASQDQSKTLETQAVCLDIRPTKKSPAVFLDRDGTINREIEYLHEPERFDLLPGAGAGMRRFADMGYRIVIVTLQAGIGLGYFTKEDFYKVNRAMFRALKPYGVTVDRIYFCPHGAGEGCACRKPGTALFERAAQELNLDIQASVCIGDKTSDLEAGRRMGMRTLLVQTGHGGTDREYDVIPDGTVENLEEAAQWVLAHERRA
jgi:rfaE bifunctional protein nucleotidyltransferase chain/domain